MKPKFVEWKAAAKGHDFRENMERLGGLSSYAHRTPYAMLDCTKRLSSNHPAGYMAAVLSNNMSDIKQVSFFYGRVQANGITCIGPDVNESFYKFIRNIIIPLVLDGRYKRCWFRSCGNNCRE
jgi:DNA polymerase-3 subunit alpha